jgi:hypothetical protein
MAKKVKTNKDEQIKIPDSRIFEKDLKNIGNYLDFSNPKSQKELKKEMKKILDNGGIIPDYPSNTEPTDYDRAYKFVYKALEEENVQRKIKLAKKALEISPDVIEAYNIIAEQTEDYEKQKELYEKAIGIGKKFFGEEFFKENKGHFWGLVETRPYIRAMVGYADVLWILDEKEKSISVHLEILDYNPDDNTGSRYPLISHLLYYRKLKDVKELLEKFKDDDSIHWNYSYALYFFLKGEKVLANKSLDIAIKKNPHFGDYLFNLKNLPEQYPQYSSPGSEEEAIVYLFWSMEIWNRYKPAIDWFMKVHIKQYVDPIDGLIKLPEGLDLE